jgi:hypothetical protein
VPPPRPQLSRKDAVQWIVTVLQEQIEKILKIEDDRRGGGIWGHFRKMALLTLQVAPVFHLSVAPWSVELQNCIVD